MPRALTSDDVPQAALERHLDGLLPADSSQLSKSLIRTYGRSVARLLAHAFIVIDGNRHLWRDITTLGPVARLRNPLATLPIREKKPLLMV